MTPAQASYYRAVSGLLCAAFALVGAAFLLVPDAVLSLFDGWSRSVGLATSAGAPGEFYVVVAVAYMYLVTVLAGSMARDPQDPTPARLLVHAKLASSLLSFGVFFLRQPHLLLLVNGIVDGSIAGLVVFLRAGRGAVAPRGAERTA
jgi:hypothetical protein